MWRPIYRGVETDVLEISEGDSVILFGLGGGDVNVQNDG